MIYWVIISVKTAAVTKLFNHISLLQGKAKNMLETTTLFSGCFWKVFYKRLPVQNDHFFKAPELVFLCMFDFNNNSLQWHSDIV